MPRTKKAERDGYVLDHLNTADIETVESVIRRCMESGWAVRPAIKAGVQAAIDHVLMMPFYWKNIGGTAGYAVYQGTLSHVIMHEAFRGHDDRKDDFRGTLLHEVAHHISEYVFNVKGHKGSWKNVMVMLGEAPDRCHNYSYISRRKNITYTCSGCGYEVKAGRRWKRTKYHPKCGPTTSFVLTDHPQMDKIKKEPTVYSREERHIDVKEMDTDVWHIRGKKVKKSRYEECGWEWVDFFKIAANVKEARTFLRNQDTYIKNTYGLVMSTHVTWNVETDLGMAMVKMACGSKLKGI